MKRFFPFLLSVCILFSARAPVLAADDDYAAIPATADSYIINSILSGLGLQLFSSGMSVSELDAAIGDLWELFRSDVSAGAWEPDPSWNDQGVNFFSLYSDLKSAIRTPSYVGLSPISGDPALISALYITVHPAIYNSVLAFRDWYVWKYMSDTDVVQVLTPTYSPGGVGYYDNSGNLLGYAQTWGSFDVTDRSYGLNFAPSSAGSWKYLYSASGDMLFNFSLQGTSSRPEMHLYIPSTYDAFTTYYNVRSGDFQIILIQDWGVFWDLDAGFMPMIFYNGQWRPCYTSAVSSSTAVTVPGSPFFTSIYNAVPTNPDILRTSSGMYYIKSRVVSVYASPVSSGASLDIWDDSDPVGTPIDEPSDVPVIIGLGDLVGSLGDLLSGTRDFVVHSIEVGADAATNIRDALQGYIDKVGAATEDLAVSVPGASSISLQGTIVKAEDIPAEIPTDPPSGFTPIIPIPDLNLSNLGTAFRSIWHYIEEWLSTFRNGISWMFNLYSYLPYAIVVPLYAGIAFMLIFYVLKKVGF